MRVKLIKKIVKIPVLRCCKSNISMDNEPNHTSRLIPQNHNSLLKMFDICTKGITHKSIKCVWPLHFDSHHNRRRLVAGIKRCCHDGIQKGVFEPFPGQKNVSIFLYPWWTIGVFLMSVRCLIWLLSHPCMWAPAPPSGQWLHFHQCQLDLLSTFLSCVKLVVTIGGRSSARHAF